MSHQCSCGRDLNNNYVSYTNAYANGNTGIDRESSSSMSKSNASHLNGIAAKSSSSTSSMSGMCVGKSSSGAQTQLTAKVMFGTVGAIKELREKEKLRHTATKASDRRN